MPRLLYPQERPVTHCTGDWVGHRGGMDGCGKSRPPPGLDPRTVQPVASRYTDCAIPAPQRVCVCVCVCVCVHAHAHAHARRSLGELQIRQTGTRSAHSMTAPVSGMAQ